MPFAFGAIIDSSPRTQGAANDILMILDCEFLSRAVGTKAAQTPSPTNYAERLNRLLVGQVNCSNCMKSRKMTRVR